MAELCMADIFANGS